MEREEQGCKGEQRNPPPPLDLVSYRNACVGGEEGAGPCVLPSCSCLAGGGGGQDLVTYRIFLERTS